MSPGNLKLYSVTDCDPDSWDEGGWWCAIWAPSEHYALAWALLNYGGECWWEHRHTAIRIAATHDQDQHLKPEEDWVHEERRIMMLRLIGWREESEYACDCCGLHALGMRDYEVCWSCNLCRECSRIEEYECDCKDLM